MKVLLAGNRGYLGSVLQDLLQRDGHEVVGLDTGFFDPVPMQPRQDVRDVTGVDLDGCDAVVNLAAMCNDACGDLSESVTHEINSEAGARLARLARALGARTYVLASSCSVYGAAAGAEMLDETDPVAPETAYAASKVVAEREMLALRSESFAPVALRFATLFGDSPSFRSDIVVNRIAGTAVRWGAVRVNGTGELWRPLLHVRDAARAIALVLAADPAAVSGEVFNVGFPDQNHQITEVVNMARDLVPSVSVSHTAAVDSRSYAVCFDKFLDRFGGFASTCSVSDGMREVVEAYQGKLQLRMRAARDGWAGTDRREFLLAMRAGGQLDTDFRWNVDSLVVA
ncbi:NAD-dependent epimerase/dehydratase family protein [Saccharothrix deserti]|uniref:NAD-dependent epimerase/dehydratase family protein n=1 Tax=Saccharothrix deserti TaxID=2593674 RepID=UPI00131BB372|nr:SDR family oxidoreductase [Saccharothrix deserti]